jgi:hypothetical protein
MPKTFEGDKYWSAGYVYFTSDIEEATAYGLNRSLLDIKYLNVSEKAMKCTPNYRDIVVLGVNASKLDNIEIDPQVIPSENSDNVEWFRYKGDIKLKLLSVYKYVPFDTFNSKTINNFEKMNETRLRASQFIMKVNSYNE